MREYALREVVCCDAMNWSRLLVVGRSPDFRRMVWDSADVQIRTNEIRKAAKALKWLIIQG